MSEKEERKVSARDVSDNDAIVIIVAAQQVYNAQLEWTRQR